MGYFVGIDLHSNNSYIGIIDNQDKRIAERKLPNDLTKILTTLSPYRKKIKGVVVESTYNWYWLVDGLKENKYKVHLANPTAMHKYSGIKHTNDKSDAIWLAHMLGLGILPEGYVYPKEIRPIRDLLRKRVMLINHRTSHILSLENMILRNRAIRFNARSIKNLNNETIKELFDDEHLIQAAQSDKTIIEVLTEQSIAIEKAVIKQVKLKYPYEKLLKVDGIGKILGITIMLETGDIGRFKSGSNYSSYSRCVSSRKESNGKKKGEGNKKNGNRYLAWAYVEAANFMRRYNKEAKQWYQRKVSKTNQIVATKALANKISKACYFIIRDQSEFDSKRLFSN